MKVLLLFGLWLAVASAFAVPSRLPDDTQLQALLKRLVEDERRAPAIVIAIVDAQGMRVISHGRTGRKEGAQSVDADTVFEIGSITKPLTAAALAQLATEGRVALDDPLSRWLPEAGDTALGRVTLAQLASHTAGLPRLPMTARFVAQMLWQRRDPYARYSREDLLADLANVSLKPAGQFAYSNYGYALLGLALERAAGEPLPHLVSRRVLRPAGMHAARFEPADDARTALGHDEAGRRVPAWILREFAAAGGVRASGGDMLALVRSLLAAAPPFTHDVFVARSGVALGWLQDRRSAEAPLTIWHNGGTGGFSSYIGVQPERGVGVAVLANSNAGVDDIARHVLDPTHPLGGAQPAGWLDVFVFAVAITTSLILLGWRRNAVDPSRETRTLRLLLPSTPRSPLQALLRWLTAAAALAIGAALTGFAPGWHAALGVDPWWLLAGLFLICSTVAWRAVLRRPQSEPGAAVPLRADLLGALFSVAVALLMWR